MKKEEVLRVLKKRRLLPLVTITREQDILPIAKALMEGNLPIVEVAYRSSLASKAIEEMSKLPGMIAGAGTVTTRKQAEEAVACGAQFLVTPGLCEEVVRYAQEQDILVCPGVVSPSEVMKARSWGVFNLKFFPAGNYGGTGTLKALHGPFADCTFVPTGGIDQHNYMDYLKLEYVCAVGGSFITPSSYIKAGDWKGLSGYIRSL